jgi:hypothetical protein
MKTMKSLKAFVLIAVGLGIFLGGCKEEPPIGPAHLNFTFSHQVGPDDVVLDNIQYTNAFGNNYSIVTLRYFISDIRLNKADGSNVWIDAEHYVDITEASTLTFLPDMEIFDGDYTSISFIYGLDSLKNTNFRYTNPPESNMEWPLAMGGGYHYMKLEGKIDSAGTGVIKNYQAHSGPTMGNQYYLEVELPNSAITVDGLDMTVDIMMDINQWWTDPHTLDLNDITMVMGNMMVQEKFKANGANVFSLGSVN